MVKGDHGFKQHSTKSFLAGFSNLFWGWGGEDDDMSNRLRFMGYHISRYPMNIARYTMLNHPKAKPNPKRYEKLSNGLKRYENDGLNSVKYQLVDNKKFPLFTWILVKLQPEVINVDPLIPFLLSPSRSRTAVSSW